MSNERRPTGSDPAFPEDVGEVVYDWDLDTDEIRWGPTLTAVTGIRDLDRLSTGIGYAEFLAAASPSSRYEAIMESDGCDTGGGVPYKAVYGLLPAKRSTVPPVWVEDTGRWFADACDRPGRAHGILRVVTRRVEEERRLAASSIDAATGAFSRAHFIEHVARHLALSTRATATFAVMLIGLEPVDPATTLDDDAIAATLAHLRQEMRADENLGRHGTYKFAVLLEGCNAEQAGVAAARFVARIAEPIEGSPPTRAWIGAVLAPIQGRTPQALMQFAEEALEAARQPTSPAYVRYDTDIVRSVAKMAMQASDEILSALNDGRVALALQPIVDAKTRAPVFHEALVRMLRVDGTVMLPDALVPIAEKSGLVALVDRRVVDLAFALLTADRKLKLSINASVASLHEACWLDHLRAACKLRPDAARRLTVEITETRAIADIEATRTVLSVIKPLGVKIAIDDFGSGHSSFRALRQLPIDYLKIDGAFAQNLAGSPDDRFFIRTLIDLARNLAIPTVAEWIEDEKTARILSDWGVDYLQGHLFGKAEMAAPRPTPARMAR